MQVEVTTWYLEMTDPSEVKPARRPTEDVSVALAAVPSAELSRFFYTAVGGDWYWIDRLGWSYAEWDAYSRRVETWIAYDRGTPVGFAQLLPEGDNVEIAYFGLLRAFLGRGIGGYLLTTAVQRAWALGAKRVWVHTCSLDSPRALPNYQARGFRVYKTVRSVKTIPEAPPGPWPGAR